MKQTIYISVLLWMSQWSFAQSKISFQVGWTASQVRCIYDVDKVKPGPYFHEYINLGWWHVPYLGFGYEYTHKDIQFATGISYMSLGAARMPFIPEESWGTPYVVIPLMLGYHIGLLDGWGANAKAGAEIGFSNKRYASLMAGGAYWGNIGLVLEGQLEYKRFKLGVRGHWGLTDFRYLGSITYKHAALTTYLSYTLWDQAKARARRLERRQAKRLTH